MSAPRAAWRRSSSKRPRSTRKSSKLTLLAEENGFYLIKTADRRLGWIGKGQTAEDTSLLESLPELEDSCWIYSCGEGERNTFAVKFNGKWADIYRASDGAHGRQTFVLSMRRVLLNGQYFIWDGEQFTSRDEYKTPGGKAVRKAGGLSRLRKNKKEGKDDRLSLPFLIVSGSCPSEVLRRPRRSSAPRRGGG